MTNRDADLEKEKELELVAYGCNRRVFYKLSKFLNQQGIQSFTFYEFFCVDPISKEEVVKDNNDHIKQIKGREEVELLCPFVKRYAIGDPLLPMEAEIQETNNQLKELTVKRKIRNRNNLNTFYEPLKITVKKGQDTWQNIEKWVNGEEFFEVQKSLNQFETYLEDANSFQKREFAIVDVIWWDYLKTNKNEEVKFIYIPIASRSSFYGELLLIVAQKDIKNEKEKIEIVKRLRIIAEEDYLPLLILFKNYWCEKRLKDNPRVKFPSSDNELERIFSEMWKKRAEWIEKRKEELLKDSLIMPKYFVASSGMIKCVKEAITLCPKDSGESIPCVLVVGGPGTGKENMARLIAKYSEDFREAKIYTINMASLQPKEIAGPVVLGFSSNRMTLEGLFQQIVKETKNDPVVIIFDELNSLSVDTQGALLRLIEHRELTPIGSIKNKLENYKNKKILIIGLMNEDPEMLTKLAKIQNIARDKEIFGGLVGDIVYEYVRNLRRLRDDLYYRMKRAGIIRIPELKKRTEDLPFLFYKILVKELEAQLTGKSINIIIEYEAFEILMDRLIEWPGNVRQLQAVAKSVVRLMKAEELKESPIIINRFILKQALVDNGLLPQEEA